MTEQLTTDELATLANARALLARLSPQDPRDIDAAAREAERLAEKQRYDAEIAERKARLDASPEFQAEHAENARHAKELLQKEIEALKEAAATSIPKWSRASADAPAPPWGRCSECGSPSTEGFLYPGPSGSYLCAQHRAIHKLVCDDPACTSKRGSFVSQLSGDGLYRCPACLEPFVVQWNADIAAGNDPASRRSAAAARTMATPGAFG